MTRLGSVRGSSLPALVAVWTHVAGCGLIGATQVMPTGPSPDTRPAMVPQAAQQSGQINAAAQASVAAPGWKGLEYRSDLPWKAVVLLVSYVLLEAVKQSWIVYLSHGREMRRLASGVK